MTGISCVERRFIIQTEFEMKWVYNQQNLGRAFSVDRESTKIGRLRQEIGKEPSSSSPIIKIIQY